MKLDFDFDVEVRGVASSRYDRETVERRLEQLRGREGEEAAREREFLRGLLSGPEGGGEC